MANINQIVGNNLTALRKAKKLTQQEVGFALSYSDKSISKWELGNALPSVDILKELADFYGVSVDYLLTEGNESKAEETVKKNENPATKSNKLTIFAMSITFVWLAMASVYVSTVMQNGLPGLWIIFIWALAASFFVAWIAQRVLWGVNVWSPILLSLFFASIITAFVLQFWFQDRFIDGAKSENVAYIYTVLVPLEVVVALIYSMKIRK